MAAASTVQDGPKSGRSTAFFQGKGRERRAPDSDGDDRPARPRAGRFPGGIGARQGRPAIVRRRVFVPAPKDSARIADDVVRAAPDRFGQETIAHEI
jgi:hypothetical protein